MPQVDVGIEPVRAASSPQRDRLERAVLRRGWSLVWHRRRSDDGFLMIAAAMYDEQGRPAREVSFGQAGDHADEGLIAESVADWIMEPRVVVG